MGNSYAQVMSALEGKNRITKVVEGAGIRAEGYSEKFKDCRIKYFVFLGNQGLQRITYEPAPHLSIANNCQPSP